MPRWRPSPPRPASAWGPGRRRTTRDEDRPRPGTRRTGRDGPTSARRARARSPADEAGPQGRGRGRKGLAPSCGPSPALPRDLARRPLQASATTLAQRRARRRPRTSCSAAPRRGARARSVHNYGTRRGDRAPRPRRESARTSSASARARAPRTGRTNSPPRSRTSRSRGATRTWYSPTQVRVPTCLGDRGLSGKTKTAVASFVEKRGLLEQSQRRGPKFRLRISASVTPDIRAGTGSAVQS